MPIVLEEPVPGSTAPDILIECQAPPKVLRRFSPPMEWSVCVIAEMAFPETLDPIDAFGFAAGNPVGESVAPVLVCSLAALLEAAGGDPPPLPPSAMSWTMVVLSV